MVHRRAHANGVCNFCYDALFAAAKGAVTIPALFQRVTMSDQVISSSKRVLDPIDRVSEVLFGLIMVLTFTGSLSVAGAGRESIRTMLIGALGCNLAWGIIDGVFYLMGCLAEKGRGLLTFRAMRKATDPKEAQRYIAD